MGIILARILSPAEFGLVGMITIFIAISQSFVDSGFQQALIRKKDADNTDFSTVFYFNLAVGVFFYVILYLSAGFISRFYEEEQLRNIVRVFGLVIVINSLAIIQRVRLTKSINFKLQTKISIAGSVTSGAIGIYMAYTGFGVWSLVWRTVINQVLQTSLLWIFSKWRPVLIFSTNAFRNMFSFGSRLLIIGLLDTLFNNIYLLVIGKYFSATDLGYYTRADQFSKLPSQNITNVIKKVSYPVMATIQDNDKKLKEGYKKLIINTMYLSFMLMLPLAALAKSLIITMIGEKWIPSVIYLQLLCFVGVFYPLQALNLNILNVKGRSDLFLNLAVIGKILAIPVIIIGIITGIKFLIIGMIFFSFIAYFINSYYSGKLINYSIKEQISDIAPSFVLALFISILVFIPSLLFNIKPMFMLLSQSLLAALLIIMLSELFRLRGYLEVKLILSNKLKTKFPGMVNNI